jgi:hypothetical protein
MSRNRCRASLFSSERHSVERLQSVCRSRRNRNGPDIELGREILGGIRAVRRMDGANQEVPASGWRALAEDENAEVVVRKQPVRSGAVRHRRFDRCRAANPMLSDFQSISLWLFDGITL